jgi:hypothetical protein
MRGERKSIYHSVLRLFKCSLLFKDLKNEIPGLLNLKAKRPLSLFINSDDENDNIVEISSKETWQQP